MKANNLCSLFATLLVLTACEKEDTAVTRPVQFTATTYQTLGVPDENGKPDNLLPKDEISPALGSYITSTLPERTDLRSSNPELLRSKSFSDIAVTQQSDIFVTFVSHGTIHTNAIAFYTYPTTRPPKSPKDIENITYIFPNAGYNTPLRAGDKVKIGRFNPGTSVGFVLLQNAWDLETKKLKNDVVHFCANDVLNPEVDPNLKKHTVLINYPAENKVLIGFEDIDRTRADCDHDFNDVVVYATVVKL
jgi:hypothetical protein